jgi:hypothetical protein
MLPRASAAIAQTVVPCRRKGDSGHIPRTFRRPRLFVQVP